MKRYPHAAGWKGTDTSREAAEALQPTLTARQRDVLHTLMLAPLTGDECALVLGLDVLSVRPRISELAEMGLVVATGERRPGLRFMHVDQREWRAATAAEIAEHAGNNAVDTSPVEHVHTMRGNDAAA